MSQINVTQKNQILEEMYCYYTRILHQITLVMEAFTQPSHSTHTNTTKCAFLRSFVKQKRIMKRIMH